MRDGANIRNARPPEGGKNGAAVFVPGLECRVGKAPLAVPVDSIAQIVEYDTAPLPLPRRWIAGIGLHADHLIVTVGLVGGRKDPSAGGRRRTIGVLFHTPGSLVTWALEVNEVRLLVRVKLLDERRPSSGGDQLPPWIERATTEDGRSIGWIDVPTMLEHLTSPEERPI